MALESAQLPNRRVPEAGGVRAFFEEQLRVLESALLSWREQRSQADRQRLEITEAVESIVDGTSGRIRIVPRYQEEMRLATRCLLDYVQTAVKDFPTPLQLGRAAYGRDMRLTHLFVSRERMRELIDGNREIQQMLRQGRLLGKQQLAALLLVSAKEKRVFTSRLKGDVLQKDVERVAVYFGGHFLEYPREDEGQGRAALKQYLFDSFVEHLKTHMIKTREQLLKRREPSLYLAELVRLLSNPGDFLRLDDKSYLLDTLGYLSDDFADPDQGSQRVLLDFRELRIRGQDPRILLLILYPVDEINPRDDFAGMLL